MEVQLSGPDRHLSLVREEVGRRRGRAYGIDRNNGTFLLRAEAPLASILGYAAELHGATSGSVALRMRLIRYVRIDYNGPEAA